MFHVELRKFPHVASAFNLSRAALDTRILGPWVRDQDVELNDQRFSPQRARLTIYEGPALAPEEIGLGRGWANARRSGAEVTERVLTEARDAAGSAVGGAASIAELKHDLLERCRTGVVGVEEALAIASERFPGLRVSARLALAEQSVWELLHDGQVRMLQAGEPSEPIGTEDWGSVLLAWETWAARGGSGVVLERAGP